MQRMSIALLVLIALGCARLSVETAKPIKVDINMRVDIYQHVVKDVESINDEIYGTQEKMLNSILMMQNAYAADFSQEAQEAISNRKTRVNQIGEYLSKGYIGENKDALLEVTADALSSLKADIEELISKENSDRQILYAETAKKNGISVSEARKVFFEDDYRRAPAGSLFQVYDRSSGKFVWTRK